MSDQNNVTPFPINPNVNLDEIQAEMALVGSLIMHSSSFGFFADRIDAQWFSDDGLAYLFQACGEVMATGASHISPSSILPKLPERIGDRTRDEVFASVCAAAVPVGALAGVLDVVKDRWKRRTLLGISNDINALVKSVDHNPNDLAKDALDVLDLINASETETKAGLLNDGLQNLIANIGKTERGATTGIQQLDTILNGYKRGNFYVIAGRPGMGKSAFMCSSFRKTARAGHGVCLFSLEMSEDEVAARSIADHIKQSDGFSIPFGDILKSDIRADQLERLVNARGVFEGIPLHVDTTPRLSVSQIAARARKTKKQFEANGISLDVICVDHMGLVEASKRYAGNKVAETGELSNTLRALAKELDCCVVALSQLSREVERRDDKRPMMSDLRWTGEIEQDAHAVIFLYRDHYYLENDQNADPMDLERAKNEIEILIRKNRNGKTSDVRLYCDIATSTIKEAK